MPGAITLRLGRVWAGSALCIALTACALVPDISRPVPPRPAAAPPAPLPTSRPEAPDPTPALNQSPAPTLRPMALKPDTSAESDALGSYYGRLQSYLTGQGRLRTDAPSALPDSETLTATFAQIALYQEFDNASGSYVAQATQSRLHRWPGPVRLQLEYGALVPDDVRATDTPKLDAYAARLARVTGHDIATTERDGNFHVLIVTEDDRRALAPRLRDLIPDITPEALRVVTDMPRSDYCLVLANAPDGGSYDRAVAVIRAEQPPLMREACLHEEIAQGLGLPNDSPEAKPSIFNDNNEFALLTPLDELLLKMLYDPRVSPGMTAEEALPRARTIAADLTRGTT